MSRYKCQTCGERYAISATTPQCEVCAYAEQVGREAAGRHVDAAEAERERVKAAKAKVKR